MTNWINGAGAVSVVATDADVSAYPLRYQWSLNGTSVPGQTNASFLVNLSSGQLQSCAVHVSNVVGATNLSWNLMLASPGMVEAWGDDTQGECDRPATLTNVVGIAAGQYRSVALTDNGTVVQWGQYFVNKTFYSVTNTNVASLPPASGVAAVAAGLGQALALMTNGTVVAWGVYSDPSAQVPPNLTGVKAISCGFEFSVALLTNGMVTAWGSGFMGLTNVPSGLSNVTAISASTWHTLALQSNGTVVAWGYDGSGETNVPPTLSNVVAIAAGGSHSLALTSAGIVIAWGDDSYGQCEVPSGMSNVMAIAAGEEHSLALLNDGTLVSWGDNTYGQTYIPSFSTNNLFKQIPEGLDPSATYNYVPENVPVRLIAAGGDHSVVGIFSPLVQYLPVDVSKDLLLLWDTQSPGNGSSNVCAYYMANRPMMSSANSLGIGCATNEILSQSDFTNIFFPPILNWLAMNPTKRPTYAVLFQDLPSIVDDNGAFYSVQYELNRIGFAPWNLFVTSINMNGTGGTTDCIAYIEKLVNMASFGSNSPGQLFISATAGGYANTNWYFEMDEAAGFLGGLQAEEGVSNADQTASVFVANVPEYITFATNTAGYYSVGWDGGHGAGYATNFLTNGGCVFSGNSGWYIMASVDSYNGQRNGAGFQSSFLTWFASNAFGGINYSATPLGAVTHVEEPQASVENCYTYYGSWALGKPFGLTAWLALCLPDGFACTKCAVVGDPFVKN